jgi:hypothetical protein
MVIWNAWLFGIKVELYGNTVIKATKGRQYSSMQRCHIGKLLEYDHQLTQKTWKRNISVTGISNSNCVFFTWDSKQQHQQQQLSAKIRPSISLRTNSRQQQ